MNLNFLVWGLVCPEPIKAGGTAMPLKGSASTVIMGKGAGGRLNPGAGKRKNFPRNATELQFMNQIDNLTGKIFISP